MKTSIETFAEIYGQVLANGWSMLRGTPPPVKELTPGEAQVAAHQEWEDEGGSIEQVKKPKLKPGRKPRR
jgi:hypothetical protein